MLILPDARCQAQHRTCLSPFLPVFIVGAVCHSTHFRDEVTEARVN